MIGHTQMTTDTTTTIRVKNLVPGMLIKNEWIDTDFQFHRMAANIFAGMLPNGLSSHATKVASHLNSQEDLHSTTTLLIVDIEYNTETCRYNLTCLAGEHTYPVGPLPGRRTVEVLNDNDTI